MRRRDYADTVDVLVVDDPAYEGWVFDADHPTQGRRFAKGAMFVEAFTQAAGLRFGSREPRGDGWEYAATVHTPAYIERVREGITGEWEGVRPDLGALAARFVAGTVTALDALEAGDTLTAVHLPGAKHHAHRDRSSGFCVFADFAIAARFAADAGHRVAILDFDAHHGDGTEALTLADDRILTYSIHEALLFPGTGLMSEPGANVRNWSVPQDAGDRDLIDGVADFIEVALSFRPSMLFVAAGADGHVTDPLSSLRYTLDGYRRAARLVRTAFPRTPILMGGAGGYTPDGATPLVWGQVAAGLATTMRGGGLW